MCPGNRGACGAGRPGAGAAWGGSMGEGRVQTESSRERGLSGVGAPRTPRPQRRAYRSPFHRRGKQGPEEGARSSRSPSRPVPAAARLSHLPKESGSPRTEEARSNRRMWEVIVGWGRERSLKPMSEAAPPGCGSAPFPSQIGPRRPAWAPGIRASPHCSGGEN